MANSIGFSGLTFKSMKHFEALSKLDEDFYICTSEGKLYRVEVIRMKKKRTTLSIYQFMPSKRS
jgi:hypothetical protein